MATSKTLKPTNQSISIPALSDAPDISVLADAVDKEADAINTLWDGRVFYGTSSTSASTQEKVVSITGFPTTLTAGLMVRIKFSNNQTYNGQPTLKINSLSAVNVVRYGTTAAARYEWIAGQIVDFVYDGTNFVMVDGGIATTTYYGRTKLSDSITSTSTSLAATANAVKQVNDKANYKITRYLSTELGSGGANILRTIIDWLEKNEFFFLVEEIGNNKYVFAHMYFSQGTLRDAKVISNNGLELGATNANGTQVIEGYSGSGAAGTLRWVAW